MEGAECLNSRSKESCNKANLFWTSHEGENVSVVCETFCILVGAGAVREASVTFTNARDHLLPFG